MTDASRENQSRVRRALMGLPDGAVKAMKPTDLDTYIVVRVADEIVVDIMKTASGIEFKEASKDIEWVTLQGVKLPFANSQLLWRMVTTQESEYRSQESPPVRIRQGGRMRKPAKTFEDLVVWQKAHLFVLVPDIILDSDF